MPLPATATREARHGKIQATVEFIAKIKEGNTTQRNVTVEFCPINKDNLQKDMSVK